MKIITKLMLLVVTTQIMFGIAAVLYFSITAPIQQLQSEYGYFQKLSKATALLRANMHQLASGNLTDQQKAYAQSYKDYAQMSDDIGKLTLLPTINQEMADAVNAVKNLKELSTAALDNINQNVTDLMTDSSALGMAASATTLSNLLINGSKPEYAEKNTLVMYHANTFTTTINTANESLIMTARVIDAKDVIVADEIAKIRQSSTVTALSAVIVIVIMIIVLSLITARSISRSVNLVSKNIALMGSGDFTQRFKLRNKDEIGALSRDLDGLLESLNSSLRKILSASALNQELRLELVQIINDASASSIEIETNSAAIQAQMQNTDAMIGNASQEMSNISQSISGFHQKLGAQNHHVEETVAAVTEMMASIESITRIAEHDRKLVESLVHESDRGREVFDNSSEKVADIAESVTAIQEMASVIAAIASQTNILAMNAAIEAAHAGEFGRGFAVVAQEIGKLAEASATSSDEIAHTIKTIVVKIKEAGDTRETTSQAFNNITAQIRDVSASVGEIYSNVNEMQLGSRQILGAMQNLRSTSSEITTDSSQIEQSVDDIQGMMGNLSRVSSEVTSNISEIVMGMKSISDSFHHVSAQTEKIGEIGSSLDKAVAVFKIQDGSGAPQ